MANKVKMINGQFGNAMWVAENRVEEYKAAGHKLAASTLKPAKEAEKPVSEELKEELKEAKKSNKRK